MKVKFLNEHWMWEEATFTPKDDTYSYKGQVYPFTEVYTDQWDTLPGDHQAICRRMSQIRRKKEAKFKPRRMVEVKVPNDLVKPGYVGMVVTADWTFPQNKVPVRFSAKLLGFPDYKENPFYTVFLSHTDLKYTKKRVRDLNHQP